MTTPLPANYTTGAQFTAADENAVETEVNADTNAVAAMPWAIRQTGAHQVPAARTYWANKANTTTLPTTEDTGQATALSANNAAVIVNSGLLTMTNISGTAGGGFYYELNPASPVTRIGMRFVLGHAVGTTNGGAVCMAMLNGSLANQGLSTFEINVHLVISPTGWGLSTYAQSGGWTYYNAGNWTLWAVPLDIGTTVYEAEMILVGDTLTIFLPDGNVATFTESAFTTNNGNWGFVEVSQAVATDNVCGIQEHWWDTSTALTPPTDQFQTGDMVSQQIAGTAWKLVSTATAPSTAAITANTLTNIPNLATAVLTAPPSGQMLCRLGVYLDASAATTIFLALGLTGGIALHGQQVADNFTGDRYFSAEFLVTGLTPGTTYSAVAQVMSTVTGTSFNINPGSYINAILVVEPIVAP